MPLDSLSSFPGSIPEKTTDECSSFDLSAQVRKTGQKYFALGPRADLWPGKWNNDDYRLGRDRLLGVKIFRGAPMDMQVPVKLFEELMRHNNLWGSLNHKNVAPVYGVALGISHMPSIVMPRYKEGNAVTYLRAHPLVNKLKVVHDIASGLQYLHTIPIIHGDLKGSNVLVNENGEACIADYDLFKITDKIELSTMEMAGSVRWMAPEIMTYDDPDVDAIPYSTKGDVYAFGMTILEVTTGAVPFRHIKRENTVIFRVLAGERPERPEDTSILDNKLWELLERCWDCDAGARPTMAEVIRTLPPLDTA